MQKIINYMIFRSDEHDIEIFEQGVKDLLRAAWQPMGGLTVTSGGTFAQVLVKYEATFSNNFEPSEEYKKNALRMLQKDVIKLDVEIVQCRTRFPEDAGQYLIFSSRLGGAYLFEIKADTDLKNNHYSWNISLNDWWMKLPEIKE